METSRFKEQQRPTQGSNKNSMLPLIVGVLIVVILGVGSAWLVSSKLMNKSTSSVGEAAPGSVVTATSAGMLDPNTKYDTATGNLKEGGIDGEGIDHLEGDNGPSHFVYLTSSVVDLSGFIGKNVQVWGQTLAAKHAPWLMDVAKIQIVQ
jgi:hypothetical protein